MAEVIEYYSEYALDGIARIFPEEWTDEQVMEWNDANCNCYFHRSQREGKRDS